MLDLENEIKQLIIDTLRLEDTTLDNIDSEAPLFGEGLGLDSIDALELGVALKKKYSITFSGDNASQREHFYSVKTLATFVANYLDKNNEGK